MSNDKLKRYEMVFDGDCSAMEPWDDGEWCKYEDVEKLLHDMGTHKLKPLKWKPPPKWLISLYEDKK